MRLHSFLSIVVLITPLAARAESFPANVAEAVEQGYHSTDPEVLRRAARVMEDQIKTDPAQRELQRALAILLLDRLREPAAALPWLEKIVADSPGESAWQQSLARALRATGQSDRAITHFAEAAKLQPSDGWPRYELGNTLSGAGRYAEAATAYRRTIEIDGKNTDARLALAKTLWAGGEIEDAKHAARAVLEYDPLNSAARKLLLAEQKVAEPSARIAPAPPPMPVAPPPVPARKRMSPADAALADAYHSGRESDFAHAAEVLEESLRRTPGDLPRRKALGYLYLDKLHAPARAVPHLEKVVQAVPGDAAWWQLLAKAQASAGEREAAVRSYRRAADRAPRDVWSRYHLACALRDAGRRPEAESTFREALRLEPKNRYVRRELARCAYASGNAGEAATLARELLAEDPRDADAHALLGDVERSLWNFTAAGTEYQAALAADPSHGLAQTGIREIRRQQRPEVKLAYYTFDDTDGLRQSGAFSHLSLLLNGRWKASVSANERWFEQDLRGTVNRFEAGLGLDYRAFSKLQIAAGVSFFKTERQEAEFGGNIALYYQPATFADGWISYRSAEPVNDSFTTAELAFSQNILSAGLNLRPTKSVLFSVSASTAEYSDDNLRRFALVSLGWTAPLPGAPVVRLEYEWLDYERKTSAYSSPDNYARFRPVLEFTPRLTDWLKLELHGELSYVFEEEEWGTGVTAGVRVNKGDSIDLGIGYMKYEIPGGQTSWSGEGFKVDLSARF